MFITVNRFGYVGLEQVASGDFLMLMQEAEDAGGPYAPIRAIVLRKVALRQMGHWMIGARKMRGHWISLSGSYGSDGLPRTVPSEVFALGIALPDELREAWNKGDGWNGAGSEAPAMAEWAKVNAPRFWR